MEDSRFSQTTFVARGNIYKRYDIGSCLEDAASYPCKLLDKEVLCCRC